MNAPCVLFGGSFDPVHYGHLRLAVEVGELLQAEVRLLPSPAQAGKQNRASARQRIDMLRLAVAAADSSPGPRLIVDESEVDLRGEGDFRPVFTVDTLGRYRQALSSTQALIFVMGMDSLLSIRSWHRWPQLLQHAHLLVVRRPGSEDEAGQAALAALRADPGLSAAFTDSSADLLGQPAGLIYLAELSLLDISSSRLRELISHDRPASYLTEPAVLEYIAQKSLYSCAADHNLI